MNTKNDKLTSPNDLSQWYLTPAKCNSITTTPGERGLFFPKSYVDVPAEPWKLYFLIPIFLPNNQPISIPASIEKHPILPKLGAFYNNFLQIRPFLKKFGLLCLWWKATNGYTKIYKKAPQKTGTYIGIPCQCENPHPPVILTEMVDIGHDNVHPLHSTC